MFELVKESLQDFKASYKKYLSFALLYMFFTSFLFFPVISFMFNRMLKIIGTGSLLNADVYKIGMSSTGLLFMLLISFLAVVILFVEFGSLIIIAQQKYFDKNILVSDAFVTTVRKLPKLLGFGLFQLILLSLLIIPFIDFSTFRILVDVNIPIFLTNQYYQSTYFSLFLYLAVFLLAIYLFIRWLFILHYIFIEEKSIYEAMKCSWKMTKFNKRKIIFNLCMLNLLFFIILFLFVTLLSYIPSIDDKTILGDIIGDYLITFSSFMTIMFSLLLMPINIIIITRLFYQFKKNQGEIVNDSLALYGNNKLFTYENRVIHFFTKRRSTIYPVIIIVVTGMLLINDTLNNNIVYLKWNVQVAAHRGDPQNAPENSLSGIRSAIEKRVDAVEIDVMLTKDGVVILNHDATLQRVAGIATKVNEMTYEEVSKVDLVYRFPDKFIGEKIPTLDEVLEEIKEENIILIIDLKPADSSGELANRVVDLIEKHEIESRTYVQAFDNNSLQEVRNRNSEIKIGQILYVSAGSLADLDVDFYTIRQTMLSERFIKNARKQNREVWVWTVNIERNMREVLKYDIDGIITNYPEKVQSMLGFGVPQE
ncbi:glycerophosphoryl diester phosphodiesterase membrane domain-containing protein [Bacillaceae bacterium IKA-2]|nr:glycerophosphoryl diester phosphodiesterase membrane domain-containing protein [Bacillaceae bacterium IKA-2]